MKEFLKKYWSAKVGVFLLLFLIAISPLMFRAGEVIEPDDADLTLVVMTPHNETIQREFGEAFTSYWKEKTGKTVYMDWRTPGGTSEIRMVLDSSFSAAEEHGDEGIGVDVFFGGGDYIFGKMAEKGRLEKLRVFESEKHLFSGEEGIPMRFTGERYWDENGLWVGTCLSQFGICYNVDGLKRLGLEAPERWDDLGDPRYFGRLALADPTKSGSVAKAFEMLVQEKIHLELKELVRKPGETRVKARARAVRVGWEKGLNLIQKISANARYFTDNAKKIPHDVAQGDAVAGMCVDFYGRTYNEKLKREDGSSRLQWVAPKGGSSMSVDPVAVFKGAPNSDLAQGFVEFLMSKRGQIIWNTRPGVLDGAKYGALRRLPVRPDVYTPENLKRFTDAEVSPYENEGEFMYDASLTGPAFAALQLIVRATCIDVHEELKKSWSVLIENGLPERALQHFHDMSAVSYEKTMVEIRSQLNKGKKIDTATMSTRISRMLRRNYTEAMNQAKEEF